MKKVCASFPGSRSLREQEERVLKGFWPKMRRVAGHVPFAQDAVAAFFCAIDPQTPRSAKAVIIGALAYFILPTDAIPDFLPLVGFTDDAAALTAAIGMIASHLRDRHYDSARAWLSRIEEAEEA